MMRIAIQAMRYDTHHDISTLVHSKSTSTNFVLNRFKNCIFSSVLLNINILQANHSERQIFEPILLIGVFNVSGICTLYTEL